MKNPQFKELFRRYEENPILRAENLPYPANSVFNPGATLIDEETLLLMRVEDRQGISHLTLARSRDGMTDWKIGSQPTLTPAPEQFPEEVWGIEDPRITYLEEEKEYVITYTAYSRGGPLVSLACTKDFRTFQRMGPVMPPEDKDAALLPRRFNGRWLMLHRPVPVSQPGAHIWLSYSPDLKHWGDHGILIEARRGGWWDANKIGLGPPPLETSEGWLVLYHGVRQTAAGSVYRLGLALLDLKDPSRVLRRSNEWIFGPEAPYERAGDVNDVVFPCGWVLEKRTGKIRLYYGAADTSIALATGELNKLLDYVMSCPVPESLPFHCFT
jgi:predicted GH43/DUF377 family glycosyl hydrolase